MGLGLMLFQPQPPGTTVIIPTYNEEGRISSTITTVLNSAVSRPQIIVSDGYSSDNTIRVAHAAGATVLSVRGGRAAQLNAGARLARAPELLFLHADTAVPLRFDEALHEVLMSPRVVAGAFRLRIGSEGWRLRVVERIANLRANWGQRPYGDQGLFMRKDQFEEVGGYREMPFLEDYEMVRRISKRGRIAICPANVVTSAQRWETLGVVRTTIMNQLVIGGYHVGVPVARLHRWYRGTLQRAIDRQRRMRAG